MMMLQRDLSSDTDQKPYFHNNTKRIGPVHAPPSTMVCLSLMMYFKGTGNESICVLKWSLFGCD